MASRSSVIVRTTRLGAAWLAGPRAAGALARVGEIGTLVDVEVEVDRIERDDVGEHRLVGVDEVADGDELARDPAGERRLDLGELEVEPRLAQGRLGAVELGAGGQVVGPALVEELLGDVAGPAQGLGPLEVVRGELDPHLRGSDVRLRLLEGRLVGPRVDGEEGIARP